MATRKLHAHPLHSLLRTALTRTAAGALGAATPLMALANPTGGQVVAGSASISNPSANGMVVNQNTQRAVIDWQSFSVGSGQYVQFVQPNSSSVVLNKVIGGTPSSIFGDIKANGQVFLVNTNGIYFAPGSSVDVQGLVASTLDMDNAAFMRGKYQFNRADGSSAATVVNQGSIVTARSGYVVLAGDYVQNDGVIDAQSGRVVLAAGNNTTLTLDRSSLVSYVVNSATLAHLAGVENTGTITANGGGVIMTADVANALTATAVNNSGLIMAQSIRSEPGAIVLMARGGDIENSGTLDASAAVEATGVRGGTVLLRGDGHTQLDPTSVIDTSGNQAKGGFIELSGHTLHIGGEVTAGRHGDLLIDPSVIHITNTSTRSSVSAGTGTIGTGFIVAKLNAGSNVTIVASNSISNTSGTSINATGAGDLRIAIGTVGGTSCGIGGICVGTGTPGISPGTGGTINLTGLTIHIAGDFKASAGPSGGDVTLADVAARSINVTAANITTGNLHATGPAAGGDINLTASHNSAAFGSGNITVAGTLTADNGKVKLFALGGGDSSGANIHVTGNIAAGGSVDVQAHYIGGTSSGGGSIKLANVTGKKVSISAVGSHPLMSVGNITATGAGAAGGINLHGSGSGGGSGRIKAGNLTANGHGSGGVNVSMFVNNRSADITVGAISAPSINVSLFGNGDVTTGPLSAVSATGRAHIYVSANAQTGSNAVHINGAITASGKLSGSSFSIPMPGLGAPVAADVTLQAFGPNGAAHDVRVTGNVSITAAAGAFSFSSPNESGPIRHFTGNGQAGAGVFQVMAAGSLGSASVGGNIAVTGTDALVMVRGADVKVHGVTATGKGHDIHRKDTGSVPTNIIYSSHNTAGAAVVDLGGWSGASSVHGATSMLNAGAIAVSGKGLAQVNLFASDVVAGNITATATAATGNVTANGTFSGSSHVGSTLFFRSLADSRLLNGNQTVGLAGVSVGLDRSASRLPPPASGVTLGAVTVSGVGRANIDIEGQQVRTKSLSATATKGIAVGSGAFHIGGTFSGSDIAQTFDINGGEAGIHIETGSGSSTSVTISGNLVAKGPAAGVGVSGNDIAVSGNVSVTGSGGSMDIDTHVTSYGGAALYHTHVTGPGELTGVHMGGATSTASVDVGGSVTVHGPGLVGVFIVGNNVSLGGLSASASAARAYSVLDTRVSATVDNFTLGSVTMLVAEANSSSITGPATITGNVTLNAQGNAFVPGQINVGGTVTVTVAGGITTDISIIAPKFNEISNAIGNHGSGSSSGVPSGGIGPLTLKAAGVSLVAGGNIDLTSANITATGNLQVLGDGNISLISTTLKAGGLSAIAGGSLDLTGATVNVTNATQLVAGFNGSVNGVPNALKAKDIILSGVNISTGIFEASAGGTIHNGGGPGTLTADALSVLAGRDIDLSSTDIIVGAGTVPGVTGDTGVIAVLAGQGIGPASLSPNATFIAGGDLILGNLSMTGSYLYLQAASVSILGKVTVPKGTVVQVAPIDSTATMGFEDKPASGSDFNLSNSGFLSLFPQITLVLGTSAETGAATLAGNGGFDIGDDNLVVVTTGAVTGLDLVTSTGLVTSLLSLLEPPVLPTQGEIDPNSGNTGGSKKHGETTDGVVTDTGTDTLIDHDNQPPAGTCH